jgi:hypothetical protein
VRARGPWVLGLAGALFAGPAVAATAAGAATPSGWPKVSVSSDCATPDHANGRIDVSITDTHVATTTTKYWVHAVPKDDGGTPATTSTKVRGGQTQHVILHVAADPYTVTVRHNGSGPTRHITVDECVVKDLRAHVAKRRSDGFHVHVTLDNSRSSVRMHAILLDNGVRSGQHIAAGQVAKFSYKIPHGHHTLRIYYGKSTTKNHLLLSRRLNGAKILERGMSGANVKRLEEYLDNAHRADFYDNPVGGYDRDFGSDVESGLRQWQHATGHAVTGRVQLGSRQWMQLKREATRSRMPHGVDRRAFRAAKHDGWAVDASKDPSRVWVLHYQKSTKQVLVTLSIAASYGDARGPQYVTAEGVWHIYRKEGRDYTSTQYKGAPMPWATFFHGGQALHEDPLTTSHGCIHIPSYTAAKYIHDLPYGTAVVVHK